MSTYEVKFINSNGLYILKDYFTGKDYQDAYNLARAYYPGLIVQEMYYIDSHVNASVAD